MIRALAATTTWWGRLSPVVRAQAARFARVAMLAIIPQLLAAAADPRGLTLKFAAAAVTAGLEAGWRAVMPPPDATPVPSPAPPAPPAATAVAKRRR